MEPKEWQHLLDFFKHVQAKIYRVKFHGTITMADRRRYQPLLNSIDLLVKVASGEIEQSYRNFKYCRNAWLKVVDLLKRDRDFFDEYKKDKELKLVLKKFLERGTNEQHKVY
ncbi:MAG: hypothetical protein JNL11_16000 [Bdellovibrionaceae bacterium]|nr:hypothetical protein [Pseudobdellovibrionaceae bacterium]